MFHYSIWIWTTFTFDILRFTGVFKYILPKLRITDTMCIIAYNLIFGFHLPYRDWETDRKSVV